MKNERVVLYIGKQRDLFSEIESYFRRKEDSFYFYTCIKSENVEVIFDLSEDTPPPSLIIIDFCEERKCLSAMEAVSILKNWSLERSFPVCAVFDDKEQAIEANQLFGMGLNYCFLKGVDTKQSLNSLFYIAYEDEGPCISYALAKLPKVNASIKSLGYISSFDENSLTVDKDFQSEGEELAMETYLFEEFCAKKFALDESFEKGFSYHTPFSEVARIPFATGWDVDEDCVFEDTFHSWLTLNREGFVLSVATVFVYSPSPRHGEDCVEVDIEEFRPVKHCGEVAL